MAVVNLKSQIVQSANLTCGDGGGDAVFDRVKSGAGAEVSELVNVEHIECYNDKLIVIRFVDCMPLVPRSDRRLYYRRDPLIKYSEAKFSPVSSCPADCIQLARPSYYRNFEDDEDLTLIADSREGKHREISRVRERGSPFMEDMKRRMNKYGTNVKIKLGLEINDFWMYCTSIDPQLSYKRKEQMKNCSPLYNFMMSIQQPSKFAIQLGRDVAKQSVTESDFSSNSSILSGVISIHVCHGRVIYLDDAEKRMLFRDELYYDGIMPFVKGRAYQEQQEYRFVITVGQWCTSQEDVFYLKFSDDLRNLLEPV